MYDYLLVIAYYAYTHEPVEHSSKTMLNRIVFLERSLFSWQSHQMTKPFHSLLIDIIHDWVYTDSFSNVLVPDLIPPSLICSGHCALN